MKADVLIVGTGVAGLVAADFLAHAGKTVVLVTKENEAAVTNTYYAQGGIVGETAQDDPEKLAADIMAAGADICNPDAVRKLAEQGPPMVQDYLREVVGVPFTMDGDHVDCTAEGAHSVRRVYHCADYTGKAIQLALLKRLRHRDNVVIRTNLMAIDLITNTHHSGDPVERYRETRCFGAYMFNLESGSVETYFARDTILATGGVGMVYLHTTNPAGCTGDGVAMAYRAGVPVINAEFVQFHPTTLYLPNRADRFLISESVRGEGATLVDRDGRPFMKDYHPDGDLASRDIVARSIFQKMLADDVKCVYLDLRTLPKDMDPEERFPQITETCNRFGIKIPENPIPVVPAAHYFCGGIKTDLDGATAIPGLYAIGECACSGIHGGNRLASTSLLEGLLLGRESAARIQQDTTVMDNGRLEHIPDWVVTGTENTDPVLIQNDVQYLRTTMWNYAGVIRTSRRLERARNDLAQLFGSIEAFYRSSRLSRVLLELRNMVTVGRLIASAASRNRTAIGCHWIEPH